MDTQTQRRVNVQRSEDLARLADQAERRGIRILLTADGEHFATSSSNPTTLHRVSERGCDCRGFSYWMRCSHHSLLLAQLGALPDVEPDIVVDERHSERCRTCRGEGYVRAYVGGGLNDWTAVPCSCTRQHAA
ncbi:MAG: hypothetical protein M3R02_03815 [Chloroflexota bacterium]|nr:hypothetical protein [Chloroflexota bacterium]